MVRLGTIATQHGVRLDHVGSIDSTSAKLMQQALQGDEGPIWLLADEQQGGKGRRGRFWNSPKGNLYASLLLTNPAPAEKIAQLSFVVALAVRDAVVSLAGTGENIELKWPNDLIIAGKKCAGLLLEGGMGGQNRFVVIGIGVNVLFHPDKTNHPAGNLCDAGISTSAAQLFEHLSDAMIYRQDMWQRGENFGQIRQDWLQCAFRMGKDMQINTSTESFVARLEDVDLNGNLMVNHQGRKRTITAGEIFPLDMNER